MGAGCRLERCRTSWQEHSGGDIRAYYLEAALELVGDLAPGSRSFDAWFYEVTEAGKTILEARRSLKTQEAPFPFWFYMVAGHLE